MVLDRSGFSRMMALVSSKLAEKGMRDLSEATALLSQEAQFPSDPRIGVLLDKNLPRLQPFFEKKKWWPLPEGVAPAAPDLSDDQILELLKREIDLLAEELRKEAQ